MTPYELLDLALSLSNRIDTHWTLFISVHLALIGGIIYVDRPLFKKEKVAALLIYTGFAFINYMMMRNQALFLDSIYQQLFAMRNDACCINNKVINYIVGLNEYDNSNKLMSSILITHITMYIILTLSVFYDKALPESEESREGKSI